MASLRSTWAGTIGFSLVAIPCKLYKATESKDLEFHLIHAACGSRIQQKRICVDCQEEVAWEDLGKGWDYGGDKLLPLTDDDLESMTPSKAIEIKEFVKLSDIDPIAFVSPYFVEPQPGAQKAYALLYRALGETGLVAVATMFMRTRQHLVTLRPVGGLLLLSTMLWPDEVRSSSSLNASPDVALNPGELKLAINLVKTLTQKRFDYAKFTDRTREELAAALQARAQALEAGKPAPPVKAKATATQQGQDLLKLLRESVAISGRSEPSKPRIARRKS